MTFPRTIHVHAGRTGSHLQGIALDPREGHLYLSFTTCLLKTDLTGRILGSVEGIAGHLGCIAWNSHDRRLYGSLEYKDDTVGKNILHNLGLETTLQNGFYMARFDADAITRPLDQDAMHDAGPEAVEKFFVYTGATHYGIQNLEYDPQQKAMLAAVYPGKKKEFPNYSLFFIDAAREAEGDRMFLTDFAGHDDHRFCGSHFPYGSTGLCHLGDGYYYIGHDLYDGTERGARVELWRFDTEELTFHRVEE